MEQSFSGKLYFPAFLRSIIIIIIIKVSTAHTHVQDSHTDIYTDTSSACAVRFGVVGGRGWKRRRENYVYQRGPACVKVSLIEDFPRDETT